MPTGTNIPYRQEEFLATIKAAGPGGITRKKLVELYAGEALKTTVDRWIRRIAQAVPPVVYCPRYGVFAALTAPEHTGEGSQLAADVDNVSAAHAVNGTPNGFAELEIIDFDLTPYPEETKASAGWVEALRKSAVANTDSLSDIKLNYPDEIECAIFSSGVLEIYSMDKTISISAPVLSKLRRFLGLFAEEA